jgi:DNA-binding PadR family transcriptional regulator
MSTGHVLLGLLAGGNRHGYELKKEHDERFQGARPLAFGQVYAALDRLQKKGHVEPIDVERVDGPDRTVYRLTDFGRTELDAWLSAIEPPAPFVANPLATKATIALLVGDPAQAADYLRRQRAAHLDRMRHLTQVKANPTALLPEVLAADYAIVHLDADLQWLDLALDRITALNDALHNHPHTTESESAS